VTAGAEVVLRIAKPQNGPGHLSVRTRAGYYATGRGTR
jgi:hypothetical protein